MLTHGTFEEPGLITYGQWFDQFRTEYQKIILDDLWYHPARGN